MLDIEALKKEQGTFKIKAEIVSGNEEGIAEIISTSEEPVRVKATGKGSGTVRIKISIEKKVDDKIYTFYKTRKVKITKDNNNSLVSSQPKKHYSNLNSSLDKGNSSTDDSKLVIQKENKNLEKAVLPKEIYKSAENEKNILNSAWLKDRDGKWYYLNSDGIMQRGWVKVNDLWYYLNDSGVMLTGWIKESGKWYYLKSDGSMAVNTTINGYKIGMDGAWIK